MASFSSRFGVVIARLPHLHTHTCTLRWMHMFGALTCTCILHRHAPTSAPHMLPPCSSCMHTHTHRDTQAHTNTLLGGTTEPPIQHLLCPAFAVSKSVCTERPGKLKHRKRDVREVNTTPYSAYKGEEKVTKHILIERGRGGRR